MYNYHNNHNSKNNSKGKSRNHSGHGYNHSNRGASYVWRLTWWETGSYKDYVRVFTNKQQALSLKARLDGKYNVYGLRLEKYVG